MSPFGTTLQVTASLTMDNIAVATIIHRMYIIHEVYLEPQIVAKSRADPKRTAVSCVFGHSVTERFGARGNK